MNKKKMLHAATAAVIAFALAGCATPYQSKGLTGGFSDTKIDNATWRVRFDGNGYAKQDLVWNYWIYRCAELTIAQGYTGMLIETKKAAAPSVAPYAPDAPVIPAMPQPPAAPATPSPAPSSLLEQFPGSRLPVVLNDAGDRIGASGQASGRWSMMKTPYTRSTQESGNFSQVAYRAPTYIYVPGGTITTWHADGIVHMFNESSVPFGAKGWLRASKIIELLKPYIDSSGKMLAPSREYILAQAMVLVPSGKAF